jgi:hypothetical protein
MQIGEARGDAEGEQHGGPHRQTPFVGFPDRLILVLIRPRQPALMQDALTRHEIRQPMRGLRL